MPPAGGGRAYGVQGEASRAGGPAKGTKRRADPDEAEVVPKRARHEKAQSKQLGDTAAAQPTSRTTSRPTFRTTLRREFPVPQSRDLSPFDLEGIHINQHHREYGRISPLKRPRPRIEYSQTKRPNADRGEHQTMPTAGADKKSTRPNDSERSLTRDRVKQHRGAETANAKGTTIGSNVSAQRDNSVANGKTAQRRAQDKTLNKTLSKVQTKVSDKTQSKATVKKQSKSSDKTQGKSSDKTQEKASDKTHNLADISATDNGSSSTFKLKTKPTRLTEIQKRMLQEERIRRRIVNDRTIFSSNNPNDYVFFCNPEDKYGWLGPQSESTFSMMIKDDEHIYFKTAAHYIMYRKCRLFPGNKELSRQVLDHTVKRAIEWGRKRIENFDEFKWKRNRMAILSDSMIRKFTSSNWDRYKLALLATGNKTIVAAIEGDKVWGIGVSEKEARKHMDGRRYWGDNLLGISLMLLRDELRKMINKRQEEKAKVKNAGAKKLWEKTAGISGRN
ncbi:hypothetical protein FHL15_011170 [Xylaria flabelliformis]|uniref:NADAR domain-containing protein n=1 Tax=Xylaria flabelliformis TaxID=2512241 RepID=A0A553HJ09_9PEZI|nr:hypothetical protein FHL15_011170 [Xylaria flabelliformis]